MTNMPEAKLAREAELCYASVAMITDYDSWHPDHGEVDVSDIIRTLMGNADKGRDLVRRLPALLGLNPRVGPLGVDQGHHGTAEFFRKFHDAQSFAIALGCGLAEVPGDALSGGPAFLVADDHDLERRIDVEGNLAISGAKLCKRTVVEIQHREPSVEHL